MRIALGQINTTVGDLTGNAEKMMVYARRAAERGAEVIAFPELSLTGYPPRDLVEKPSFLERAGKELERLATETAHLKIAVICGVVESSGASTGKKVLNTAAVLTHGKVGFRQHKRLLPTYDVFDEGRYFLPADRQQITNIAGAPVAVTICEDAWNDKNFWERRLYQRDPVEELAQSGAKLLISINASPYHMGKRELRRTIFTATAQRHRLPVVYVNSVGGNDQLVFDGSSFAMDANGRVVSEALSFAEDLIVFDSDTLEGERHASHDDECDAAYEALVLGTRDYIRKCGFRRVLIGLSGGIDSSLTAAIAVEAVGKENVVGVAMPGPFSSDHSVTDARELAARLGIRFEIVPITGVYDSFLKVLDPVFDGVARDAHGAFEQVGRDCAHDRQQE